MNKKFDYKNKIVKRLISFALASVFVFNSFPVTINNDKAEKSSIVSVFNAHAETDPDELARLVAIYDSQHNLSFTSGGTELSEYSKCFEDPTFAANHANDVITLAPTGGAFRFDEDYNPIGSENSPFRGTIKFTTTNNEFSIENYRPIFNYVSDSVGLMRLSGSENIPININRLGSTSIGPSPLFARHVKGSGANALNNWMIRLNANNATSYSGVIYEMSDGAKINLTFTDDSTHTEVLDPNGNIVAGSIINSIESGTNYGILCGKISGNSQLKATYTVTDTEKVTFIGTSSAYCGGFVGELKSSTFELVSGSSNLNVDFKTAKNDVGFICGHAESSTITLPTGYSFQGTIDGNNCAGGIAGYCKNTVVNYVSSTGTITLDSCNVKNGTKTGGVFGYYECDTYANDILLDRIYSLTSCTITGTGLSGGIAGEYKPTYDHAVTIDLNKYTLGISIQLKTGTYAGGLFGKYTAPGNVTITDTDTTNAHFVPPSSSVAYGGVIGEYVNSSYSKTLSLSNFTVNNLNCSSSDNVGGIIRQLTNSTYVNVSSVSVTNATASSTTCFGGIISTLDSSNAGSFIDVTGNFTLSLDSGKTYKGGAIAGSFKKGVVRLAGTTDISGAKAANGYAQLVNVNDETLVYAKGSGSDSNWTLKRNADTTASDLGQWGEVVRIFDVNGTPKNAEEAGIVSVANNKVTVAQGVTSITDTVSFAKCALNMQLNDGNDHGALCFTDKTTYPKSVLLGADLTVNGTINLSHTGLLGLMRDGGSDFSSTAECFTGSIAKAAGASTAEIKLATGESYGTYPAGSTGTGGKIYLANTYGHNAQGLFAFAKDASATNLTVSGDIKVERKAGANKLYAGALFGAMTNGATVSGVTVTTTLDVTKVDNASFFIGGVAGVFDGSESSSTPYVLSVTSSCSITPTIKLYGAIGCTSSTTTNVGGILGSLEGKTATKYDVSVANSDISPIIQIDSTVADVDNSYLGGMIGRVVENTTNERKIDIDTVTMASASIDTKAKYPGGLLGAMWDRTLVTIDGLTITGSTVNHKYSASGSKQSGLVFRGSGKWDINSLSIGSTTFNSANNAPASFGMIVNEAYSGSDGLYINLKNSGYSLTSVVITVMETLSNPNDCYVDEIAADTQNDEKADILVGGDGTGIININMNSSASGTLTKIVDEDTPANGTGTYQNRLYGQLVNLVANQNSRYYYNLDVMLAKGTKGSTAPGGEKFLLWSVTKYAAKNIKGYFKDNDNMITETAIDLSGLSYYPISGGAVTLPTGAIVTFGFNAVNSLENVSSTPDNWSRNPDDADDPNTVNARNQHYMMQTGLFTTVSSLSATNLTLKGSFGYIDGAASGALINGSTSGSVSLTNLKLDQLVPSNSNSYLLINYIDGTGTATPTLTVNKLRAENYNAAGVTLPVAKSLFGKAQGQNMTMTFSDIKLDARDGSTPTDTHWSNAAASDMDTAYGTSRSIFSTATFFNELLAAKTCNMEYNYPVEADWGYVDANDHSKGYKREVTYGKEVTDSRQYPNSEKSYYLEGETDGRFTNPVENNNTEFNFSGGFLPYVANYTEKGNNATYPVVEIKVNYKAPGLTVGCGTYNDPYIISSAAQFETVAKTINGVSEGYPSVICLPNNWYAEHVSVSWHDEKGCGKYQHSGTNYNKTSENTQGLGNGTWTETKVRYYLASAYYKIEGSFTLPDDFEGIGQPGSVTSVNGNFVFHGVIVGDSQSKPTITNPTNNPLIYISNGSVIKNINIRVTGDISKSLDRQGDNALYGYKKNNSTDKGAEYYGGVIGEIMGGDNIIDDVTVTYSGATTLSGSSSADYKHLIAEGGMVGAVVNGALIFRGSNTVSGRTVSGGGIYSNQFVGRVINGYAVYESVSGRTGSAPDNYNTYVVDEEDETNVTKTYTYPIDTIDRSNTNKLDVNWSDSTITVPDAQSLYILSLITQSIASTANTSGEEYNKKDNLYSPSYGYYSDVKGIARLGDYSSVGCGTTAEKPDDYSDYAKFDSVNNYTDNSSKQGLLNAPIPYIIYRYTERKGTTTTKPAQDFPARKMTFDNNKFWDITLSSSDTFASFDSFQAFRGIGSVGINAYSQKNTASKTAFKIATFDGGNNTIKLHISLPRYRRDQENYYHKQNKSLTQVYSYDDLNSQNYGHDQQLWQVMGIGVFDCVLVKNDSDHDYQFQNFKLQGTIEDVVYDSAGNVVTGTCTYNNKNEEQTGQTQLFCVGGVVGKRVTFGGTNDTNNEYDTDCNYSNIRFDGLTITGAYSCGGLVGIDASKSKRKMEINNCNSTLNGISITGGYYGKDNNLRHGIGSFVGMTFWCRPYIDGGPNKSDIYASNVTTSYNGTNNRCVVGGLIGYTGSGAEIKNIDLKGLGTNPVVGSENATNAAGYIGFSQTMNNTWSDNDYVIIENCTLNNLSVKAKNSAAGFLARCGNSMTDYYPKYIKISNCAVIGDSQNKPQIKTYGTANDDRFGAAGFIAEVSFNTSSPSDFNSSNTSVIENSYITGYTIEGRNTGGIIGAVSNKPIFLKNMYVKDCDIITNNSNVGGIVGLSKAKLAGYNLKIENVDFKKNTSGTLSEYTSNAGIIVGANNSSLIDKFVGIGAYHTDASKVPTAVVKTNGTNTGNFFVFADYLNASATDLTNGTGYASTFGDSNNSDLSNDADNYPLAPFLTVNPRMTMGTGEYLTGDGASNGKAGEIYKDAKAGTSNRKYTIGSTTDPSFSSTDQTILAKYINDNGTYKDGVFKISTAAAEFGQLPSGVQDFTMLVINDDSAKANDITPFIKSYIRLVTNAAGQPNSYTYNQYAYGCGNTEINNLYTVVIKPCYYSESDGKFVLGEAGNQGLNFAKTNNVDNGQYEFVSAKADSASDNDYQFSLIDVQFKDPTDESKIAYHLYVPVYTKKILSADFYAVSMNATPYYRSVYATKIASEIAAGKNATTRSILVDSTNEWTTTFIRYTYPKDQISTSDNWNFDKSIVLRLEDNFNELPSGTKLILLDPNANEDQFYTMTLDGSWQKNADITLNLSDFIVDGSDAGGAEPTHFAPQNLSDILADTSASNASGTELYEDYYISLYVPKQEGKTHAVLFSSGTEMHRSGGEEKANIESKLWSYVFLGDLFEHEITSFTLDSIPRKITAENNKLTTRVTATVKLKDKNAGPYLNNSDIMQAFYISLTSHDAEQKVSDSIYGINQSYIKNEITITYNDGTDHSSTVTSSYLGPNYVELKTGSIKDALLSNGQPVVTISAVTEMTFVDINAFPYNPEEKVDIGTQVSIKSNIAYREADLRYSTMKKVEEDPAGTFYYVTTQNHANLSFSAVPSDDSADEIGLKTNNRSLLGINGKYSKLPPIIGKSIYDANDIVNYESSTAITYKISLYKKVTDNNGTRYQQVNDISDYLENVSLTDSEVTLTADTTDPKEYVFTGPIIHEDSKDQDKMFEANFSCNVITGDTGNREYANYKIYMTAELTGSTNTWKDSYIIYTNAKFDPSVIDIAS